MDENKKPTSGAPSSDTTSALFVSARKKQLEQQEAERRAKEKEEQRLAAEAEVSRLEKEVEERRQKAEEDARRIAEEAITKQAQAAADPNAVLGGKPEPPKPAQSSAQKKSIAIDGAQAGILKNKKILAVVGGAAALIILAVILIAALPGGGEENDVERVSFSEVRGMNAKRKEALAKDIAGYATSKNYSDSADEAGFAKEVLEMLGNDETLPLDDGNPMLHMSGGPLWYAMSTLYMQDIFETEWLNFADYQEITPEDTLNLQYGFLSDPANTPDDIIAAFIYMDTYLWQHNLIDVDADSLFIRIYYVLESLSGPGQPEEDAPAEPGELFAIFALFSGVDEQTLDELIAINTSTISEEQGPRAPRASDLLDATALLSDYNLSLSYPSASFAIVENTGSELVLDTLQEGLGGIGFIMSEVSVAGMSDDEKMDVLDAVGTQCMDSVLSANQDGVIGDSFVRENEQGVYEYIGTGTFTDELDVSCSLYVQARFFEETSAIYVLFAAAQDDFYEACKALAIRVEGSARFG